MPHIDMMKGGLTRLKGRPDRLIFIDLGIDCLTARQDIVWVPGIAMPRDTFLVAPAQHAHTSIFLTRLSQCDPNSKDLAAVERPMRGVLMPRDEPSVTRLLRIQVALSLIHI